VAELDRSGLEVLLVETKALANQVALVVIVHDDNVEVTPVV
jgi:hypothetical protein